MKKILVSLIFAGAALCAMVLVMGGPQSDLGVAYAQATPNVNASALPRHNTCSGQINIASGVGNSAVTYANTGLGCLANYKNIACVATYPTVAATPAAGSYPLCVVIPTVTQVATQSAATATATAVFAVMPTLGGGPTPTIVFYGIP